MPMPIQDIQAEFLSEAASAPSLFADLAKVELYIAESYRSRAFIELLQNADDAGARRFVIRQIGMRLVVANDGRPFTRDDVVALCRSGASNKHRGSGTIGYRGIGFKSVAGIAHEIEVVSGDCAFRFSKPLTRQHLDIETDVPLIRIPHPVATNELEMASLSEQFLSKGMGTVFIFSGLDERMVAEEAQSFDESAMLFLNNVSQVEIDLQHIRRELNRNASRHGDGLTIEQIGSGEAQSTWLVSTSGRGCERVAFAMDADIVVPAPPTQSVIHAFMPTTEFAGALLKMNGDFSTDPSRKSVDLDAASASAFQHCADLLASVLQRAIATNSLPGIFSPLPLTVSVEGRFRKTLREVLTQELSRTGLDLAGVRIKPLEIRLPPEWLPYEDYERLCQDLPHVPQATLSQHPQFPDFLKWLGARSLALEEALQMMQQGSVSAIGCARIFARAARQYRYELTEARIEMLAATPLLSVATGVRSPREYCGEPLLPDFRDFLIRQEEVDDVRYLSKRLGLPNGLFGTAVPSSLAVQTEPRTSLNPSTNSDAKNPVQQSSPFNTPAIKAWRSAEQNALAWLSALADVISVKDVSKANVGYDLEAVMRNGQRKYIEVKSVTQFGEPIRLTNNEHATAYQLGSSYLLAFVVNGADQFNLRFVPDPVRTLALEKRCEQWSWYCEDYLDQLEDCNDI